MSVSVDSKSKTTFLFKVLRLDGLFALISGAVAAAGFKIIASLFDLDQPAALLVVGIMVLGYGAALLIFSRRESDNRLVALPAITLNTLWVVISYLGLLFGWWDVNSAGKWTIALVAEVVFIFAVLEVVAMRRMANSAEFRTQGADGIRH